MSKRYSPKRIAWSAGLAITFFLYFTLVDYYGKKYRENHSGDTLQSGDTLLNKDWKFHSGDNLQWASAGFSDEQWQKVNTDSMPLSYHGEISWFRHKVNAGENLFKDPLVIHLYHAGASEIFYDGIKVASFGNVSGEKEKEVCMDPSHFPISIRLGDTSSHLIAVRYSELHYPSFTGGKDAYPLGFEMSLVKAPYSLSRQLQGHRLLSIVFAAGIFLLTLSFVHILLYVFYRKAKENLFYSIFAFCYAMIFILQYIINSSSSPQLIFFSQKIFLLFLNPLVFLALLIFISRVYNERYGFAAWLAGAVGSIGVLFAFTNWLSPSFYFTSLVWYALFNVIIMTRGTYKAMKENRPGAKILGTGIGVFALFLFVGMSIIFFFHRIDFFFNTSGTPVLLILFFILMSIPISTSVYLAYNFSNTNKVLSVKLDEVEKLSAITIEQEKEKQKMLEGQKEVLEQQVKERTAEIREQKELIEEKNKSITDSILYALRIQQALLPTEKYIRKNLKDPSEKKE
ncbi:MAG: hypothetical protein HY064_09795 [Bacteroidetes bacterium]|nr:hypothetical protein [Bacteroidota bacterium]